MSINIALDVKTPAPWNESEINILLNALKTEHFQMLGDPMKYVSLSKELPGRSIREIVIKICELKSQVPNISIEESETLNHYHTAIQDNSKLLTEIRGNILSGRFNDNYSLFQKFASQTNNIVQDLQAAFPLLPRLETKIAEIGIQTLVP